MKARKIYERALALINERDGDGAYHADVRDFEKNAPEVMNSLISLLVCTDAVMKNKRVRESDLDYEGIKALDDEVPLHPALSSGVLPFALASLLVLEEDAERSSYFYKLFRDAEERLLSGFATGKRGPVVSVY